MVQMSKTHTPHTEKDKFRIGYLVIPFFLHSLLFYGYSKPQLLFGKVLKNHLHLNLLHKGVNSATTPLTTQILETNFKLKVT